MAGILPQPTLTGPSPIDEPRQDSAVRLPLRSAVGELLLGSALAAVVSLVLQFAVTRIGISEPSYAPEALASVGSGLIVVALFLLLTFRHRRSPRWLRLAGTWVSLSAFSTLALAIPLQGTRFYFGGSSTDNGFRMQYMTRMASSPALADMNYADTAPYYPAGWFWLGGRFANLLGWEGWAAYKPYALLWVAITSVVTFTLWSIILRRKLALLAALGTTLAGMLHGIEEPYAWPSAAWLAPIAVLAWHTIRREPRAPRWTLVCIGLYVGFASITYTLHFGFAVLLVVTMAIAIGASRVHAGDPVRPTVQRLFLRLVPIGVVSALVSLLVWLPYLISTHFLLDNPRSAALHYLPEDGAFLPVPMTEASVFGGLCLAGMVWLFLRCRHNEIAAAMLTIVLAIYCWFALSTLALVAKTTLLAFRLNVVLGAVLAAAGVLGLLELIGYLRTRLDVRYALQVSVLACVAGLIGTITLTQEAIGTALGKSTELAYENYYPTGDNAMGARDPAEDGSWSDDVFSAVAELSQRPPQQNLLLTTNYKLMSFRPYWGFQQETPHYANPLAEYDARADEIKRWTQAKSSQELLRMLDSSRFKVPNVFVLRTPEGREESGANSQGGQGAQGGQGQDAQKGQTLWKSQDSRQGQGAMGQAQQDSGKDSGETDENVGKLSLTLKADAFPQLPNVRDYEVHFDPAVFESPEFVQRDVGPYTIIARK